MSDSTASPGPPSEVEQHMEELAQRSGHVEDDRPLVAFLYLLMRDQLSVGHVEELLLKLRLGDFQQRSFTNGYLARYAQDVADRLVPG